MSSSGGKSGRESSWEVSGADMLRNGYSPIL